MQGLTNYGSESDEEASIVVGSSDGASLRASTVLRQDDPISSKIPTPLQAPSNRLKASLSTPSSRSHTPSSSSSSSFVLPGVVKHSRSASSPKPAAAERRGSSASPPPFVSSNGGLEQQQATNGKGKGREVDAEAMEVLRVGGIRSGSLAEFGIPEILLGPVNPLVQSKMENFHHLAVTRSLHFNDSLSSSKAFRNPRIYAKLVEFVDVGDETGTNWSRNVWDPRGLGEGAESKVIAAAQKARYEAKTTSQAAGSRSSIAFAPSSHPPPPPSSSSSSSSITDQQRLREQLVLRRDKDEKRKTSSTSSRWDNSHSTAVGSSLGTERDKAGNDERDKGKRERNRSRSRSRSRSPDTSSRRR